MKKLPFMSNNEFFTFASYGCFCGMAEKDLQYTKDPEDIEKIKQIIKLTKELVDDRLSYLDKEHLMTISRRNKGCRLSMHYEDTKRTREEDVFDKDAQLIISQEDLYDMADLCMHTCSHCHLKGKQDEVTECRYRKLFHRLGLAVYDTNPEKGTCEYYIEGLSL